MTSSSFQQTACGCPAGRGGDRNARGAAGSGSLLPGAVLVLAALLSGAPAQAERADRNQPLNFASDSAKVDEARQVNILSGNVEITKGSIAIRADRVEVRQGPEGYQSAVAIGWPDRRATFRQKREGSDELLEGEAERLEYDSRTNTVRLVNQAVMRRLRAGVVVDEVSGAVISYDNSTEVFQVLGRTDPTAPAGRVRGVLTPRAPDGAASAPGVRQ